LIGLLDVAVINQSHPYFNLSKEKLMNRKFFPAIIGGAFALVLSVGVASAAPAALTAVQMDGVTGAGYNRNGGKQYCKKDMRKGNYHVRLGAALAGNIDP
jgi:hypothetical protein